MQLTPISPSTQYFHGKVRKPQHSPTQSPLQPKAPILFGESSKPKKLLLAILASLALYTPNALSSQSDSMSPYLHAHNPMTPSLITKSSDPPSNAHVKSLPYEFDPDLVQRLIKRLVPSLSNEPVDITIESEDTKNKPIRTILFLFLLALPFTYVYSKGLNIKAENEVLFKALEENPELINSFNKILSYIPSLAYHSNGEITVLGKLEDLKTPQKQVIFKSLIRTTYLISQHLSQKQKNLFFELKKQIEEGQLPPVKAMALYKEALGPKFNWKPVEKLITAFMENPTGEEKPKK